MNYLAIARVKEYNKMNTILKDEDISYRPNPCNNKECDWYDDCRIIKWLWLYNYNSKIISVEDKLNAFCSLEKTINSALYDGISECIGS